MNTILITGINGYLGSNIANNIASMYKVVGLEHVDSSLNRVESCGYKVYRSDGNIPNELFVENDIYAVIHTATVYGRNSESISSIAYANVFNPLELLEEAISHNCKLFVNTDTVLERFISTYSLTKRHFQEWLYYRSNKIKAVNVQLEHFYGPGCSESNFIMSMIKRMENNEESIKLTPGEQLRDFVYISDVVSAYEVILSNMDQIDLNYSNFQVSTGVLISIKDLLVYIKGIIGSNTELIFGAKKYRNGELMASKSDSSSLKALGWDPKFTLEEGLAKMLKLGLL